MRSSSCSLVFGLALLLGACGSRPPLTAAILDREDERAVGLLRKQPTPNAPIDCDDDEPWTPLSCAVFYAGYRPEGHRDELVLAFLKAGADPNAPGPSGVKPLLYACKGGIPEVISALLTHGADPKATMPETSRNPDGGYDCESILMRDHRIRLVQLAPVLEQLKQPASKKPKAK